MTIFPQNVFKHICENLIPETFARGESEPLVRLPNWVDMSRVRINLLPQIPRGKYVGKAKYEPPGAEGDILSNAPSAANGSMSGTLVRYSSTAIPARTNEHPEFGSPAACGALIRCPPPPTLAHLAIRPEDHEAEEECLFFVALSRARDFLYLSRAERYTRQNASPSKFLSALASLVPARQHGDGPAILKHGHPLDPPQARQRYEERELSLYIQCPARYRYENLYGLRGSTDDSPYVCFHRCVHRTIGWIEAERTAGRSADLIGARAQLAAEWEKGGPVGHGFEDYYRASAEGMVASMVEVIAAETGAYDRAEWEVELRGKTIGVTPDRVVIGTDGTIHVQRIRTGRKTKSEPDHRIYALLRRGAEGRYRGRRVVIETFYLATRETVPVLPRKDDQLLSEYGDAIAEIERGEFTPAPEDARRCPNCQCYFICDYVQGVS